MIKLTHLDLLHFFSHCNLYIHLEDYKGLVLIEGQNVDGHYSSNGSGKSTLLEGIIYALTGDTLRGVGVNDVINRNYKKNTQVSLEFTKESDTSIQYKVSRYRKHDIAGDSLNLYKNGEDISKRLNKDTQKSLEDILGISYKILASTMFLGEGLSSRFTQLSDPEKKSLIESTLNLSYDLTTIRSKVGKDLSDFKLEKSNLEGRLSTLKEFANLDIEDVKKQLPIEEARVKSSADELERLQVSQTEIKSNIDDLTRKINLLKDSLAQHDSIRDELLRLSREKVEYQQELQFSESAEIPICTVCHQHLVSAESQQAFRDSYQAKINAVDLQISEVQRKRESLPDRYLLETTHLKLQDRLDELSKSMDESNSRISDLANQRWSSQSRLDQLVNAVEEYEKSSTEISRLEERINYLDREIEKYDYFYKLFSPTGIIVNILSDAIEYINDRLSTYSSILLEKDYRIDFIKGKISLIDSKGASYQSLSNGEKRRLDLSIQFALHDYVMMYCGNSCDIMFIDEIMDTLDDVGTANIIEVLRLKLEYCSLSSIFVITHNPELKSYFDNIITVKKDAKGDSFII